MSQFAALKSKNMDAAEMMKHINRRLRITVILLALVVLALLVVMPLAFAYINWHADMQACMRMLGLTEANCADYLRIIRDR